jgi:signal peptidase II
VPALSPTITLVAIAAATAGIDQITKLAVIAALEPTPSFRVELASWLALEYAENRGAAFGLFAGLSPLLAVAAIAIVVALLTHHRREADPPVSQTIAIGAIAGGAIGNVIDRLRLGHVVDFIAIGAWPNFNVADSAITLGALLLIWGWLRAEIRFDAPRPG